ncbi:MAG: B12-binding domain-containing radical SAM protein [Verrucomicrobia bacterium]|nr:B12-binding domain-containing radical SAM protein [Verrucomicrobiota bacterium]MBU4291903.1 B12-binding domain-containing radical SAM protein [Verrucomicrobiota bacterium]MBU4497105.1 B12-binding domain-containing radical SAM protein [Verrucomicrobiota bacterium]MCG2679528.1 B12-binding domain-containing radical SAM protein [Kiritimatiellia bacterium]
MKILFIYTDINVRGGARSYQFGLGSLSAMLKRHGHSTRLHYMFGRYDAAPLRAAIAAFQPDIIAFSAVSPQFQYVRRIVAELQPFQAFTLLGGQHATLAPECIEALPGLNALCVGEGEYPLLELAQARPAGKPVDAIRNLWIRNKDGTIIRNPTRPFIDNLDELPFVDRELFDYQAIVDSDFNTALFMFSRGCPYNCTFCSNHALRARQEGRYVRFRGVESCLQEIREVIGRYRVGSLYFNDDCFTARREFVEQFCARYKETFTLPFDINARPETLNDEICRMLRDAGCRRVSIGIENGSENFRREVLGRNTTNDQISRAFEACRAAGLKTKAFNIVGFPYETPAIVRETVELNARINPDSVIVGIFEPYPGTKLAEVCLKERFIDPELMDMAFVGRTDTVLQMPQFPRREILRCFRNFAFNVYRKQNFKKALFLRVYYSRYGEFLLRLLAPLKTVLRKATMGV